MLERVTDLFGEHNDREESELGPGRTLMMGGTGDFV
jgi:hypothetical protein